MSHNSRGGSTAIYVLGSVTEGVLVMAFTMVLVRLIAPDEFGGWRQFAVLSGIVWNVATYGLSRSLGYFYSTAPANEQGAIARRTLLICLGLAAICMTAFYAALPFAAERFDSPALRDEAGLFSLFLGLNFPIQIFITLLLAAGRRTTLALAKLCFALLRLAALLVLVWSDATLHNFLLAMNGFALVQLGIMLVLYQRTAGPVLSPLFQNARAQGKFTADLTGQSAAGQFAVETDKLLVSAAYPPAKFAAYSVGARELPLVPLIPFSITESIAPDLSRMAVARKQDEFRDLWHRWMGRAALLMYPVFALVLFQHEAIIRVLYTAEYLDGALPLLIIGCVIPQRVTSFYQILLCLNRSRVVLWASVAMLFSNIVLSLLFMRLFGMWGPALAVLTSEYVINSFALGQIARTMALPISRVMPWSYLLKVLVTAVGAGALALPVLGLLPEAAVLWRLVAYGAVMMVIYGAAVLTLGLVTREDMKLLRARLP
ncbi:MAG: polysaccharide biosynthesis protein [bacterium]|nr:polysaccharide biosynthesis protein [bacterium]